MIKISIIIIARHMVSLSTFHNQAISALNSSGAEKLEELQILQFRFEKKNNGDLIKLPSTRGLSGFLVHDGDRDCKAHLSIFADGDPRETEILLDAWGKIAESGIPPFPEVVYYGIDDDTPFCVTEIPNGEPISNHIIESKNLSAEDTVRLVSNFAQKLSSQKALPATQFAFSSECIWIADDIRGNKSHLIFSDIIGFECATAETANVTMLVGLLKQLNRGHQEVNVLCEAIEEGPGHLSDFIDCANFYLGDVSPPDESWTTNDLLESCKKIEPASPREVKVPRPARKKTKWSPVWNFISIVAVCGLAAAWLNYFISTGNGKLLPEEISINSESATPVIEPQNFNKPEVQRIKTPESIRKAGVMALSVDIPTDNDKRKAFRLFEKAVEQGDTHAHYLLAKCYIYGQGTEVDTNRGIDLLEKGASLGDGAAYNMLGICCIESRGVERDFVKAAKFFQTAVDLDWIPSHFYLGACYAMGQGVERNPGIAADLFQMGADRDDSSCMLIYGRCYEVGFGRSQNHRRAALWCKRSLEKGNLDALRWWNSQGLELVGVFDMNH